MIIIQFYPFFILLYYPVQLSKPRYHACANERKNVYLLLSDSLHSTIWLTIVKKLVSGNWGLSSVADPGEGPGGTASPLFLGGRPVPPPPSGGSVTDPGEGPGGPPPPYFLGGDQPPPPHLRVGMSTWTIASVSKVSIVANTFKGSSGVCTSSIHVTIMAVIFAFINICLGSERESDKLSKGTGLPLIKSVVLRVQKSEAACKRGFINVILNSLVCDV